MIVKELIVAQTSGFCFGVDRAVQSATDMIREKNGGEDGPIYMFGELIHNRQVIDSLKAQGMRVAMRLEDIPDQAQVLIRAHGVDPKIMRALADKGCHIVDRTCPFVSKIHRIVSEAYQQGKTILIAGSPHHPEVIGINGECENQGLILDSVQKATEHPFSDAQHVLVAQTTFSTAEYEKIQRVLRKKIAKLEIFDTICNTTENRQKEAEAIASAVDVMFVLGSVNSSNTQKLLTVCRSRCGETHLIEYPEEVKAVLAKRKTETLTVGIIAGASTPERIIREVIHTMTEKEVVQNQEENEKKDPVNESVTEDQGEAVKESSVEATEGTTDEQPTAPETKAEPEAKETPEPEKPQEDAAEASDTQEATEEGKPSTEDASDQDSKEDESDETSKKDDSDEASKEDDSDKTSEEDDSDQGDISFTDFIDNIPQLKRGATVKGVIVRYDDENVYVDVKDKSEGRIPKHEFDGDPDFDLDKAIEEKTEIDVYVRNIRNSDMGKEIVLSKARVDFGKYKALIEDAYNEKTPISVKVVNVVKDGVIASHGGVDIYVHRTQLEMGIVDDLEPYRGKTFDILVTQFDPDKKRLRVSGSRRALLSAERKEKAEKLWETIQVGDVYNGIVRSLTDFGAFVDIGGVDGLVHVSELSWKRIRHPSDVVSVGDEIEVRVKDFDKERKRISLGYKKPEDDPYHDVESRFPVGSIVRGTVVRMFPFGAFVEIAPGVDALCHISQIANVRLTKPDDVLKEGMEIDARVLEVSNETRRISISIKEVEPINPEGYEEEMSDRDSFNSGGFDNQAELDKF